MTATAPKIHTVVSHELEDEYELLAKRCNLEPMKELLRKYQADETVPEELRKQIRVSGPSLKVVATENLRKAVEIGAIPHSDVFSLLIDAEENGNQHIFFFRPASEDASSRLNNPDSVAESLFGKNWRKKQNFPQLKLQPEGYRWSDFRAAGNSWVAKLYGHATREERTNDFKDDESIKNNGHGAVSYKWQKILTVEDRNVCLARWDAVRGLFEIRADDSVATELMVVMKDHLDPAINFSQMLEPWNLSLIRQKLLRSREANKAVYTCGDWTSLDSNKYRFLGGPHLTDGSGPPRASQKSQSILSQIAKDDEFENVRLVVNWILPDETGNTSEGTEAQSPSQQDTSKRPAKVKSLRTILGTAKNSHEIIITAQSNAKAVDYVIDRLLDAEQN